MREVADCKEREASERRTRPAADTFRRHPRRFFPRLLALAALAWPTHGLSAQALPEQSDRIVRYDIVVRLDPSARQLRGTERLTWRNPSADSVGELWFHLYLNAFKNSRSTFFRESGGQLRRDRAGRDGFGWIDITSMRLADGEDLTPRIRFEHPDDNNEEDQTVARIPLSTPVPPGGSVSLEIAFQAQLPQVFARTGYKDDFYLVGQWFPKLGVYEPAGKGGRQAGGWNCHQFHANSEFYADFGAYRVEITLPADYVLGATGRRISERRNGDGTKTCVYEEADVHDFAWTADPDFIEVRRLFSANQEVRPVEYEATSRLLGRPPEQMRLSDVEIILLLQPGHRPQAERHIDAVKQGLKYFGLWYGRYPYRTITVVDPAPGAGGAGGMEYPTLITAGSSFLLNRWPLSGARLPEMVTIHEFGHQYWYGMAANNEFEEAWLDEGITSYSAGKVMEIAYGPDRCVLDLPGLRLGEIDLIRMGNGPDQKFNAILTPAWKFVPRGAYSFYSYTKPEIVLRTLESYLGRRTMGRIMRTYQERWRFRHPSSEDFFAVASELAGRDLDRYFSQTIRDTGILDYEVASVSSEKLRSPYGFFDGPGGRKQVKQEDAEKEDRAAGRPGKPALFETEVVVQRRGEVVFPVEIEFKFEGIAPERQMWDGRERLKRFHYVRPEKLEWASVDPDRRVYLDVDWLNNSIRTKADSRAPVHWAARWMFWLQNLIAFVGM